MTYRILLSSRHYLVKASTSTVSPLWSWRCHQRHCEGKRVEKQTSKGRYVRGVTGRKGTYFMPLQWIKVFDPGLASYGTFCSDNKKVESESSGAWTESEQMGEGGRGGPKEAIGPTRRRSSLALEPPIMPHFSDEISEEK